MSPRSAELLREIEAHRQAVRGFVATAESLDEAAWNLPRAVGKWSPAEITEHLRLSCAAVTSELAGNAGLRVRTRRWQQVLFRILFVPRILKSGRFPEGVRAVREIRPGPGPYERSRLLGAFRDESERFLQTVEASPAPEAAGITHPFLGRFSLAKGLRFMTQHVRHHHRQIGTALAGDSSPGGPGESRAPAVVSSP